MIIMCGGPHNIYVDPTAQNTSTSTLSFSNHQNPQTRVFSLLQQPPLSISPPLSLSALSLSRLLKPLNSHQMLSQVPKTLSFFQNPSPPIPIPNPTTYTLRFSTPKPSLSLLRLPLSPRRLTLAMASDPGRPDSTVPFPPKSFELDRFAEVANKVADASGEVIRKFFRQKFDILDKEDFSKFECVCAYMLCLVAEEVENLEVDRSFLITLNLKVGGM